MADYTQGTWTDDDGSGTTGTAVTKARMDNIEGGVKDAAEHHRRGSYSSRPAAATGNKNWLYTVTDDPHVPTFRSTGSAWEVISWNKASMGLMVKDRSQAALAAHSRTGNVLTASANGSINSTSAFNSAGLAVGHPVLVKDETAENGVYVVTAVGAAGAPWVLTRAVQMDAVAKMRQYMTVIVQGATARTNEIWQLDTLFATTPTPTLNTTTLTFTYHGLNADFDYRLRYMADIANGVFWPLIYDPDTTYTYQWIADGPSPLWAYVATTEQQGGGPSALAAMATAGPAITLPLAGDFMVDHGCGAGVEVDGRYSRQAYSENGSTTNSLNYAVYFHGDARAGTPVHSTWLSRSDRRTGFTAGMILSCVYDGIWNYAMNRWISAVPLRVGVV